LTRVWEHETGIYQWRQLVVAVVIASWASVHSGRPIDWFEGSRGSDHQLNVQSVWLTKTTCCLEERRRTVDWRTVPRNGRWKPGDCSK